MIDYYHFLYYIKYMNDEIIPHVWPTEFDSIVFVDDMLIVNNYRVEVGFDTSSDNPLLHDVAFEKVQMFFDVLLNNSIIISKTEFNNKTTTLNNNYVELPNMLNDQTLGSVIFSKLISLTGKDLEIRYVKISSSLGKNIKYTIDMNCPELHLLLPSKDEWWDDKKINSFPWWLRSDSATYDEILDGDKIYQGEFNWDDHFESELEEVKNQNKKNKFQIISGGKDEIKPSK